MRRSRRSPTRRSAAKRCRCWRRWPTASACGSLKWELEDLAFRLSDPDTYRELARAARRAARRARGLRAPSACAAGGPNLPRPALHAEVSGRPKHLYSIYSKMRAKSCRSTRCSDLRALRVMVDTIGPTAMRRWTSFTRCGRSCRRSSTTTSRAPSRTATSRCTRWWWPTTGDRSRCRFARATCIASPNTASPRTGATRKRGPGGRRAARARRGRSGRADRLDAPAAGLAARRRRGAGGWRRGRCGRRRPDLRADAAGAGDRAAGWAPRRSTSPTTCTPPGSSLPRARKVDGQLVPLNTPLQNGQMVEIVTAQEAAARKARRATGSIRRSASCAARARAPRCASGSTRWSASATGGRAGAGREGAAARGAHRAGVRRTGAQRWASSAVDDRCSSRWRASEIGPRRSRRRSRRRKRRAQARAGGAAVGSDRAGWRPGRRASQVRALIGAAEPVPARGDGVLVVGVDFAADPAGALLPAGAAGLRSSVSSPAARACRCTAPTASRSARMAVASPERVLAADWGDWTPLRVAGDAGRASLSGRRADRCERPAGPAARPERGLRARPAERDVGAQLSRGTRWRAFGRWCRRGLAGRDRARSWSRCRRL